MIRKAEAKWKRNLIHGSGRLAVGSGALDVPYSFKSRLEDGQSAEPGRVDRRGTRRVLHDGAGRATF